MGKKSKRSSRATTIECLHGALPAKGPTANLAKEHRECLEAIMINLRPDLLARDGLGFSAGMIGAMKMMERNGTMDAAMVNHVLAQAVDLVLKNHVLAARKAEFCCAVAITMEYWLKVGGAVFEQVVATDDVTIRRDHPWFTDWNKDVMNQVTKRDVIRFLTKRRIPSCTCLDAAKNVYKKELKSNYCHACAKIDLDTAFSHCSKCHIAIYCNEACRAQHWPEHRLFCEGVPRESSSSK